MLAALNHPNIATIHGGSNLTVSVTREAPAQPDSEVYKLDRDALTDEHLEVMTECERLELAF